jgi:hypothetical protein
MNTASPRVDTKRILRDRAMPRAERNARSSLKRTFVHGGVCFAAIVEVVIVSINSFLIKSAWAGLLRTIQELPTTRQVTRLMLLPGPVFGMVLNVGDGRDESCRPICLRPKARATLYTKSF